MNVCPLSGKKERSPFGFPLEIYDSCRSDSASLSLAIIEFS